MACYMSGGDEIVRNRRSGSLVETWQLWMNGVMAADTETAVTPRCAQQWKNRLVLRKPNEEVKKQLTWQLLRQHLQLLRRTGPARLRRLALPLRKHENWKYIYAPRFWRREGALTMPASLSAIARRCPHSKRDALAVAIARTPCGWWCFYVMDVTCPR